MRKSLLLALHTAFFERPRLAVELSKQFDSLEDLKRNAAAFWIQANGSPETLSRLMQVLDGFHFDQTVKILDFNRVKFISIEDEAYPGLLKEIPDPPLILFYKGDIGLLWSPTIGVVGPRKASEYGVQVTRHFVSALGMTVVSGLAQGIDTVAHRAALDQPLPTIAVMGTSFDHLYPESNRGLFQEICKSGLVVTEYPLNTKPMAYHFPKRNRLISGVCRGVLVCEAGEKSGSLITARCALDQNREVFAVPGSIFSAQSTGVHRLIQDGAKLVTSVEDVWTELNMPKQETLPMQPTEAVVVEGLTPAEEKIWSLLSSTPKSLDELAQEGGVMIQQVLQHLTVFELNQWVVQVDGQRYVKRA